MPRSVLKPDHDREIEAIIAARERFAAGFRRSRRGNLWRRLDDLTLTVFRQEDRFKWSISYGDGSARFSDERFDTEEYALSSLWNAVR